MTTEQPKLTRRQAVEFLHKHGFPIGAGTFNRLCSPAYGEGPPVAGCGVIAPSTSLRTCLRGRTPACAQKAARLPAPKAARKARQHTIRYGRRRPYLSGKRPRRGAGWGAVHEDRQPRCRSTR
jgi:hypothetical protein